MAGSSPVLQGSTGSERDGDRTITSSLSWVAQLQAYLKASQSSNLSSATAQQRKVLGDVVLDNPNAAEAWLNFLQHEESIAELLAGNTCWVGSKKLSLLYWYQKATELVQRSKGQAVEAYVAVWLGYARHQWACNEDEARDTFKTLRNLQIASSNARLYYEWALLETGANKLSKALGVLHKGISEHAQPLSLLTGLLQQLQDQTGATAVEAGHTATVAVMQPVNHNAPDMLAAPLTSLQLASNGGHSSLMNLGNDAHMQPHQQQQQGASVTQHSLSSRSSGGGSVHTQHTLHRQHAHQQAQQHAQQAAASSCHTMGSSKSGLSMLSSDEDATVSCHKGALDGNHTLTSAGTEGMLQANAAGTGTGAGNNTATMNIAAAGAAGAGIKRFGFKSKALRVTSNSCSPVGTAAAAAALILAESPTHLQQKQEDAESGAGKPSAKEAYAFSAQQQEAVATSRKRRPELPGAHSPCSLNPAAVLPDDTKRRNSPDTAVTQRSSMDAISRLAPAVTAAPATVLPPTAPLEGPLAQSHDENRAPQGAADTQQRRPTSSQKLVAPPPPLFDGKPSVPPGSGMARAALQPLHTTSKDTTATAAAPEQMLVASSQQAEPTVEPAVSNAAATESQVTRQQQHSRANMANCNASSNPAAAAAVQPLLDTGSAGIATAGPQVAQAAVQPSAGVPPERLPDVQRRAMEDGNWVYVSGLRYQKLDCVGRGGSSKVFKVLGCNRQIYALKRVRMNNKDPEAIRGFIDEISLLKQLRNTPNIIQLISAQVFREEGLIYMVLEYGDIDLARLLHNHEETRKKRLQATGLSPETGGLDENFIRLYWQQMLQAVQSVHELRIVHSDLKPANFMLVQGQLKLIDFGIAKSIQGDTTSISREAQVGTLNYMSPEAIQGGTNNPLGGPSQKVGRPSDVWSLGCILYQMIYGRTPFADLPFIPKMNAICNFTHTINFAPCCNPAALDVMRTCLDRNPRTRATIQDLLQHPFLHPERAHTQPVAPAGPATAPAAATAGDVDGAMEAQLKSLVSQIAQAGASGTVDVELLTRQVLEQLTAGNAKQTGKSNASSEKPVVSAGAPVPPPPPPPPPPRPPPPQAFRTARPLPPAPPAPATLVPAVKCTAAATGPAAETGGGIAGIAAAAAAAAAARQTAAGTTTQARPTGSASSSMIRPGGMLMGAELQAAILQQRTQLRPVGAADAAGQAKAGINSASQGLLQRTQPSAAPGLDAILKKSLQRIQQQQQVVEDDTGATEFVAAGLRRATSQLHQDTSPS